jgi:hypothetical protein
MSIRKSFFVQALDLMALMGAAVACAQEAGQASMPSLLRGVRLGMSEAELHKVRPAAQRFEIFGEPEVKDDPNPLYMEELSGSPFFDSVSYVFCDRKLCAVTLAAVGEGEAFEQRQARIAQGAVKKWGDRPERLLSLGVGLEPGTGQQKRGALLWKEGPERVLLTFAPASKAGPGEAALAILDPEKLPEELKASFFQSLTAAGPGQDQRLFAPLERQVAPPLFE